MDYGQPVNHELNKLRPKSEQWNDNQPEHDPRSLGNKVISSPELKSDAENQETPLQMPPDYQETQQAGDRPDDVSTEPTTDSTAPRSTYNTSVIKTTEKIDPRAINEIDKVVHKTLDREKNPSNFYDAIRGEGGMNERNLENSYNRKLGENA